MKHIFLPLFAGLLAMTLLTGCVLNLGGGRKDCTTCSAGHRTAHSAWDQS